MIENFANSAALIRKTYEEKTPRERQMFGSSILAAGQRILRVRMACNQHAEIETFENSVRNIDLSPALGHDNSRAPIHGYIRAMVRQGRRKTPAISRV
jgi:hypothetical protein